jgi:hypothetical protein
MQDIIRKSPVTFDKEPASAENRAGWRVALSYGEGQGTKLIDLSHCQKWDLQDGELGKFQPFGVEVPEEYGKCAFENRVMINRMNRTQCAVWNLGDAELDQPDEMNYTSLQDGLAMLAISGPKTLAVMERISALDFAAPNLEAPCLIQGPINHIPCQIVLARRDDEGAAVIFTFSRGYGQAMAEAVLHAAHDLGLAPGGLNDLKL